MIGNSTTLDYGVKNNPTHPPSFFTPKISDKYSDFINMQNVVNTALKKEVQVHKEDNTELPVAEQGVRYNV